MALIKPWGNFAKVGGARSTALGQLAPLASTGAQTPQLTPPEQFFGLDQPATSGQRGAFVSGTTGGDVSTALQRFTPVSGLAGGGADLPAYIDPAQYSDLLRRSPQAMAKLSPAVAATLQAYSADQAAQAEQARAEQALAAVSGSAPTTGAAAAPDIEGVMGDRYSNRYWSSRERQEAGRISQSFAAQREAIREAGRTGAGAEYVRMALAQLDMQEQTALAAGRAMGQNRREDLEAQMDVDYANALLSRYRTAAPLEQRQGESQASILQNWPSSEEAWTGAEGYIRGARMDELNAIMGGIEFNKGVGGGAAAGGGAPQPWEDTSGFGEFGFGTRVTPHGGQYLGGGGAAPAAPAKIPMKNGMPVNAWDSW